MNIMAMPSEVQDMQACVWLPAGNYPNADEFPTVTSVSGYDLDSPISGENFPSLDVDRGGCFF